MFVAALYYTSFCLFSIFLTAAFMPPGVAGKASLHQWLLADYVCLLVAIAELFLFIWICKKMIIFLNKKQKSTIFLITLFSVILFIIYMFWQAQSGSYFSSRNLLKIIEALFLRQG